MPFGDYGAYLGRLDIILGILVAAAGVVVAIGAYVFLRAAVDDVLSALPHLGDRIAEANRSRHAAQGHEWVCRECRSINAPNAIWCYRGCGSRYQNEDPRIDLRAATLSDLDAAGGDRRRS